MTDMSYIGTLRKEVGHKPLIMPGATVLVLNRENELLMIRRSDCGEWGLPGGMMELGETTEQTARRELFEETNLEADEMELFGVFSGPELYFCYPNGDEVYNVSVVYLAHAVRGDLRLSDGEHTDFAYFARSDLPKNIGTPVKPIVKAFLQHTRH